MTLDSPIHTGLACHLLGTDACRLLADRPLLTGLRRGDTAVHESKPAVYSVNCKKVIYIIINFETV
jgi:hypothetical protein